MIAAVYCTHYGLEWLRWSLRSVRDFVDDVYVFYTPTPSYGHTTDLQCPEKRGDLLNVAREFGAYWHDVGPFDWEGQHRDYSIKTVADAGYDQALVVDADELWDASHLAEFIQFAKDTPVRNIWVAMNHFWRSTKWYCKDDASPLRLFNLKRSDGEAYYPLDKQRVFHMGYAQSAAIVRYKMLIHGHFGELRHDWFDRIFIPWKPGMGDVHPSGINQWTPIPYKDDGTLSYIIDEHKYADGKIIE